jgi:hypothetical protein
MATEEAEVMRTFGSSDVDAVVKWIRLGCEGGSMKLSDGITTVTVAPHDGRRYKERHISALSFNKLFPAPLDRRVRGLLDRSEDFTLDISDQDQLLVCRV